MIGHYAGRWHSQEVVTNPTASTHASSQGDETVRELRVHLAALINRWNSHRFRSLHAGRLTSGREYYANEVLYALGWHGPSRPSFLAEQLGSGRANVSKVVNRLEDARLVIRLPDPDDSRSTLIALTRRGRRAADELFHIGDEMIAEMTADWTPRQVQQFTTMMGRFAAAANQYEEQLTSVRHRDVNMDRQS